MNSITVEDLHKKAYDLECEIKKLIDPFYEETGFYPVINSVTINKETKCGMYQSNAISVTVEIKASNL